MKFLFISFFVLINIDAIAQQGKVVFNEPEKVKALMNSFVQKNKANRTIRGWRIQILSTTDRKEMETTRSRFSSSYPSIPNNWKHISPYYQIRIGAYRTKEEMQEFLYILKKEFPAAIAVQDEIEKYDLIGL
jgi:hypothetical protein